MKRIKYVLLAGLALYMPTEAFGQWVPISGSLPEVNIHLIEPHPKNATILLAASDKNVYRTDNSGQRWKRILNIRGENKINYLLITAKTDVIFVATTKDIRRSVDFGKKWEIVYRGIPGSGDKSIFYICEDPLDANFVWLATAQGLIKMSIDGTKITKVQNLPDLRVYSIWMDETAKKVFLSSDKGIYRTENAGLNWERVLKEREDSSEQSGASLLSQFQIEEIATRAMFSNFAFNPNEKSFLVASRKGVFESGESGQSWSAMSNNGLPSKTVNWLTGLSGPIYAATDRGAFLWDQNEKRFKDISEGLPTREVFQLAYHDFSGDLFAATKTGIFRWPKPLYKPDIFLSETSDSSAREVIERFDFEPSILQVQKAVIQYAEVYPEKIQAWRRAAGMKAWLPTVSFGTDRGVDQNVDIDRGGTNDPDRFIIGPEEKDTGWQVGASWDLGELVWNNDQTSIDTRSKLMVELRDDLLNEVNHLYFERRRLQVELLLHTPKELPLKLEKELKLEELTARIDALTGGYFSQAIKQRR